MNQDIKNEVKLVYEVINHPSGFDLDIAGVCCIRRYEYPKWAVEWETYYNPHATPKSLMEVKEFDDAMEAAQFFVELRHKLELGLDYETIV